MRARYFQRFSLLLLILVAGVLGSSRLAVAKATIEIVPLAGFDDPTPVSPVGGNGGTTVGQQRLNAFQFAADKLANMVDSSVKIKVEASLVNLGDCIFNPDFTVSVILGGAGANTLHRDFVGAPLAGTWYPAALANGLAEADLCLPSDVDCPAPNDAVAMFNSVLDDPFSLCRDPLLGITWYYGLDASPPPLTNQIDFVSVVFHELIHALGFFSAVDVNTGELFFGFNDSYTEYLFDSNFPLGSWPDLNNPQRAASSVGENLIWTGPEVTAANGGDQQMYAPPQLAEGSSVSHFDLTGFSPPLSQLMEPAYKGADHNAGLADPLLQDIGWNLTQCTITEPVEVSCSDDIDNDCDDAIDSADSDCPQPPPVCVPTQSSELDCADGIDNDCNGDIDGNDANCQAVCESTCTPTEIPEVSCSDNIDNDCDNFVDLNDTDCAAACTATELPSEVSCSDNIDNDCDGFVDLNDTDCAACIPTEMPEVSCSDGIDNNCDGTIDCDDSDCAGDPSCSSGGGGQCVAKGSSCTQDSDCCSNKCRGAAGSLTCK